MVGTEAIVVRVTRPDTLMIRSVVPQVQSMLTQYMVLEGVECKPETKQAIVDWCEVHQEGGRFRLLTTDWFRDSYGRLLGDLQDISSGETLTGYLLENHLADERPYHYADLLEDMLRSVEPE
ncbi:MAG: hypothetical protein EBT15_07205 [Betaproteobacteria bacterium]|nr:hypothetical protein [Betaproteobacteria bacterium]